MLISEQRCQIIQTHLTEIIKEYRTTNTWGKWSGRSNTRISNTRTSNRDGDDDGKRRREDRRRRRQWAKMGRPATVTAMKEEDEGSIFSKGRWKCRWDYNFILFFDLMSVLILDWCEHTLVQKKKTKNIAPP